MIFFLFLVLTFPLVGHAYLDPGTGAMVIQAIVAAFAGTVFYLRKNWGKVKSFFNKNNKNENDDSSDSDEKINKAS